MQFLVAYDLPISIEDSFGVGIARSIADTIRIARLTPWLPDSSIEKAVGATKFLPGANTLHCRPHARQIVRCLEAHREAFEFLQTLPKTGRGRGTQSAMLDGAIILAFESSADADVRSRVRRFAQIVRSGTFPDGPPDMADPTAAKCARWLGDGTIPAKGNHTERSAQCRRLQRIIKAYIEGARIEKLLPVPTGDVFPPAEHEKD